MKEYRKTAEEIKEKLENIFCSVESTIVEMQCKVPWEEDAWQSNNNKDTWKLEYIEHQGDGHGDGIGTNRDACMGVGPE